ncbi:imelysin family protein [Frigidibacter sp. RF13]|uniref:imelysin family protein n=1 Tax=Frigidibacter sp. RF13 TaxID=2997340 RepID=UPI002270ABAE|nr:imelysin family protein [Frigidibacter sp. RF13]MCY1126003.1 imelysin family protein [Frigidibacter sp. RF13]
MCRPLLAAIFLATPALADYREVVEGHILPGYAAFAAATDDLAEKAGESCDAEALKPAYQAAFDAWMAVSHLHLGPADEKGRALAIAFWPDPKGLGAKAQRGLLTGDPAALAPEAFADQSVAARGLMGLERLPYPDEPPAADPCALIRATAGDLARMAGEIEAEWRDGYADLMLSPGAAGNASYLTEQEVRQALFTQLATALEFLADTRLGRPLGTFDRPRPERAEARASGRSLANVRAELAALRDLTARLAPEAADTLAAFDRAIGLADKLDDPVFAAVADPQGRLKVEILQGAVKTARDTAVAELGKDLGVSIGFNAADGD